MPDTSDVEPLLRRLLAQTHEISIVLLDRDGLVIGWSGAAQICFGYQPSEILGDWFGKLFIKADIEHRIPEHELSVAASGTSAEDDRWLVRKDGGRVWVTGVTTALRSEANELLGFAKVVRDRTDLKTKLDHDANKLAALERDNHRLVGAVNELGLKLQDLLGLLANAFASLEQPDQPGLGPEVRALRERATDIQRAMGQADGPSAPSIANWELALFPVELGALINDFAAGLNETFARKGIAIRVVVPKAFIVHHVNPPKINRLLGHLASNALRHMPSGGTIWLTLTVESSSVAIRLRDTGEGIAPEVLPAVFDLFSRDSGMQMEASGSGLFMAKSIADEHGGSIEVRSAGLGHGSEFTLRLPR